MPAKSNMSKQLAKFLDVNRSLGRVKSTVQTKTLAERVQEALDGLNIFRRIDDLEAQVNDLITNMEEFFRVLQENTNEESELEEEII